MVSIYDIAEIAGVSPTTVANVLAGRGRFSKKTADLVHKIAREQGYVANQAARSLNSGKSGMIGIVTTDISNDYFSSIVVEIERLMHSAGFSSLICNTYYSAISLDDYLGELRQRNSDGIFVVGSAGTSDFSALAQTPCVLIDYAKDCHPDRYVAIDNDKALLMHDQVKTLADHGCKRIALLALEGPGPFEPDRPIHQYYQEALEDCGAAFDPSLLIVGPHVKKSHIESYELIDDALERGVSFDGIVAVGDRQAYGAVEAICAHGLTPGRDILVIGMDNSLYSQLSHPKISTIDRHTDKMARLGSEAMVALLKGEEPKSRKAVIPHHVVERETTLGMA